MSREKQLDRLKEIFENTVESGLTYDGKFENIEYYNLFCKAAAQEKLYKIVGNNLCMFNCSYEKTDSVLMVFYIPINSNDSGAKNVAERVMEVVAIIEECFVTIDFMRSEEVKEDKFVYVSCVKKLEEDE
jgi:hypothetical protein